MHVEVDVEINDFQEDEDIFNSADENQESEGTDERRCNSGNSAS